MKDMAQKDQKILLLDQQVREAKAPMKNDHKVDDRTQKMLAEYLQHIEELTLEN